MFEVIKAIAQVGTNIGASTIVINMCKDYIPQNAGKIVKVCCVLGVAGLSTVASKAAMNEVGKTLDDMHGAYKDMVKFAKVVWKSEDLSEHAESSTEWEVIINDQAAEVGKSSD